MSKDRMEIMERTEGGPPIYEIRVRGRLAGSHWAKWFEGLTIVDAGRETVLRGPLPDQAALYGVLSRLRDVNVGLVSVKQVRRADSFGWRVRRFLASINWVLLLIYLLVSGGMSALVVYLTARAGMDVALALGIMFTVLGGLAAGCFAVDRGRAWPVVAALNGLGAAITFFLYIILAEWLDVALAMTLLAFLIAGGVFAWVYRQRQRPVETFEPPTEWEALGTRGEPEMDRERERGV